MQVLLLVFGGFRIFIDQNSLLETIFFLDLLYYQSDHNIKFRYIETSFPRKQQL